MTLSEAKIVFCQSNQKSFIRHWQTWWIFSKRYVLNLILQRDNINWIDDYDAIHTFVLKLGQGIVEFEKEMQFPFLS